MKEWDMDKNLGWVTLGVSGLIIPLPMAMSGAITVNSWAQLVYVPILSALASVIGVLLFCAAWNGLARILDRRWLVLLYNDGVLVVGPPSAVPGLKITKRPHGYGVRWSIGTAGSSQEVNFADRHAMPRPGLGEVIGVYRNDAKGLALVSMEIRHRMLSEKEHGNLYAV